MAIALALCLALHPLAFAADLPAPASIPPPSTRRLRVYNWTGFYIGANVGAAWRGLSGTNFSDTIGSTFTAPTNVQFMGGGQVGVNYQFRGGVVIGAEAMFDWLPYTENTPITADCSRWNCRLPWHDQQSMVDHRDRPPRLCVGPRALLWKGRRRLGWRRAILGFQSAEPRVALTSSNNSDFGWTAGFGLEWAFWNNWSLRAEYDYIGLKKSNLHGGARADDFRRRCHHV